MWNIEPYIGVNHVKFGMIKFGMSPSEVTKIVGKPKDVSRQDTIISLEMRDAGIPIIRYSLETVDAIAFPDYIESVTVNGTVFNLNSRNNSFNFLRKRDALLKDFHDSVISFDLGIAVHGLLDEEEEWIVTAFAKGYFDKFINKMEPVRSQFIGEE